MKIKHLFQEGKQVGTLYHYTTSKYLSFIILDDKLDGNFRGNSFTRSRTFEKYSTRPNYDISDKNVCIEVDGDKLSQNYHIRPINFFYTPGMSVYSSTQSHLPAYDEMEERITKAIPNFFKYVKKVYIKKVGSTTFNIFKEKIQKLNPQVQVINEN